MKELSIEEKAKRYDNLLVKLQEAKVDDNVCDERYCCVIDDIVPELAESEDERIIKAIKSEEPVSEDLEEAANDFAEGEWDGLHDNDGNALYEQDYVEYAFKAGANWQKQQDQETIELAEDHAMLAGMEKAKEQMIKDATDGQLEDGDDYLRIKCLSMSCRPQDDGKLVKLIIIKED